MKHARFFQVCVTSMLLLFFINIFSFSQDITVHGYVKNIFDKPVSDVSIKLSGTTIEAFTDSTGEYQIIVPQKGKLIFIRKGYETRKISVRGKSTIDVALELDLNGSYNQTKANSTQSTTVDNKLINQNKEVDIAQLFQTVPNVKVVYEGSELKLLIRGMRSLIGNNYALIVLNGSTFYGSLNDLDRNSIESIEVLKDAASLTSYGSKGANGVVLISTKVKK